MRLFLCVQLLSLCLLSRPLRAADGPTHLNYTEIKSKQKRAVDAYVKRVVWPTLISPALVAPGDRFDVIIRLEKGPSDTWVMPKDVQQWQVFIQNGSVNARRVAIKNWSRQGRYLRLHVSAPKDLARELYDIRVMGLGLDDKQPNALRVIDTQSDEFSFAVVSDHQLWDPSYKLSGRLIATKDFPGGKKKELNLSVTRQGFKEISWLDPDFVLHTGDLIFGLDFNEEYKQARDELIRARLPFFAIPGNHDGYAIYTLRLKGGIARTITGSIVCRKHLSGTLDWNAAWRFIGCFYGDVKKHLYADLQQDGLVYWKKQLGPTEYRFDRGRFRFIAVNTYAGTPERRHAFSIYMDAMDLHLGAPAVDNYGGYLADSQLDRIERELKASINANKIPVVFGHHDPRGNKTGRAYHPNDAFPTDPLGLNHFEEWNYDDARWDSDPHDKRKIEKADRNNAHRFLAALARYGGYYISGHVHADSKTHYPVGSYLGPFRVERELEFIRTTSAASSVQKGAYWGYRLLKAKGDKITAIDFDPEKQLASIPAGNFWMNEVGAYEREWVNALPQELPLRFKWALPKHEMGYRFRARWSDGGDPTRALAPIVVEDAVERDDQLIFTLHYRLAKAETWPPTSTSAKRLKIRAIRANENLAPNASIDLRPIDGLSLQSKNPAHDVSVGQLLLISAEDLKDEQGDNIIKVIWDLGDEKVLKKEFVHQFLSPGEYSITLKLFDETGMSRTIRRQIRVRNYQIDGGCHCQHRSARSTESMIFVLAMLGILLISKRLSAREKK